MANVIYDKYTDRGFYKNNKGLKYRINIHEFDSTRKIAPHCHDFYELEFPLEGSFEHVVDGTTYNVAKPYIYLISPLSFHSVEFKSNLSRVFSISFLADAVPTNLLDELLRIGNFSCAELSAAQFEQFKYEMSFYFDEYKKYVENTSDAILRNAFERILLLFLRNAKKVDTDYQDKTIQNVLSFLHKNFRSQIALNDIAKIANMSPNYFSAYFSQKMNMTFVEYLNSLRVNFAASMLSMPDMSIKKVAFDCGFTSPSYFSKVFFKAYGISPTSFRAKYRRNVAD